MAALLRSGHSRVAFTTNFDAVIETAYAQVTGDSLAPFHLEGAYAALDALNGERFPILAKLHGDFRFRSVKNLPDDLLTNEREIEKCFLAAADRYGIVVAGYSGRDESVMRMLRAALAQGNPFPRGVYWTVVRTSDASSAACDFIRTAQQSGLTAHLVETGPFDDLMSRLWKQIPDRPNEYEQQVRSATQPVHIPLPGSGGSSPILRTNALPVLSTPSCCGLVEIGVSLTQHDLIDRIRKKPPKGLFVYTDQVLFWGSGDAAKELLADADVQAIRSHDLSDVEARLARSGLTKSFYDRAIAKALSWDRPLSLRRRAGAFHLVISPESAGEQLLLPIADALSGRHGQSVRLAGPVPGLSGTNWAEALSIRLPIWSGRLWLMLEPSVWIEPSSMREQAIPFLRQRRLHRYNAQSYDLLDAWTTAVIGEVGGGQEVEVSCFPETDFPASFRVSTRTAYSRRRRSNG